MMNYSIAIITPAKSKDDYLLNTVLDGLLELRKEYPKLEFHLPKGYPSPFGDALKKHELDENAFFAFAKQAGIIIFTLSGGYANFDALERVGRWDKTVVLDSTEWGKDRRFDFEVQKKTLHEFLGNALTPDSLLNTCALYLRREKPYVGGIVPFPFGIESRYVRYTPDKKKDIDFVCIWGQEEHPLLRKYAREFLESFCDERGFTCRTAKTKGFDFSLQRTSGRDEFYELLSRAKVGVSIGGGGFDTVRFWEMLGNNCLMLTERLDIYHPESEALRYKRMNQFNNLYDFEHQLSRVADFLKNEYKEKELQAEYETILKDHSTKARVRMIFDELKKREVLK